MTGPRRGSAPLPLAPWLLGLEAIALVTWLVVSRLRIAFNDHAQQIQLVESLARGDVGQALVATRMAQTAGPGFGVYAAPIYRVLEPLTSMDRAFDLASYGALVLLGVAVIAASRALGVTARSPRELVNVAAVVLGVPVLACYTEAFHPADVLAVAACLVAFAAVARGRVDAAAVALGFAIVTKQWAVVPVLVFGVLLSGRDRWVLVGGSVATTVVLLLPFLVTNPSATIESLRAPVVQRGRMMAAALVPLDSGGLYFASRVLPLLLALAWCAWLIRRRAAIAPELAVAALAVGFALRPLVDPAGFLYYLAPAYAFAVLIQPRTFTWPIAGVTGGALLWLRRMLDDGRGSLFYGGVPLERSDRLLAVGTTALIALGTVLAIRRVVELTRPGAAGAADGAAGTAGSGGEAAAGGPGDAERGHGVFG